MARTATTYLHRIAPAPTARGARAGGGGATARRWLLPRQLGRPWRQRRVAGDFERRVVVGGSEVERQRVPRLAALPLAGAGGMGVEAGGAGKLPPDLLESSPVAPALHAELTSILEAHPTVARQLSRTASAGAPLLRKLPISEFLVAAYGEPAINTGTYVNADGITRTEFTAGAVPIVKLLDVRSPGEFARGHLPGAVNIPLFEDHERAEVGTLFAEKGQEYATSHGLALVGPKLRMYLDFARKAEEESSQVLVYCWRGGQRSASVGWLLSRCGSCASVNTLSGGYRAFRRWAIELVGQDSGKQMQSTRCRPSLAPHPHASICLTPPALCVRSPCSSSAGDAPRKGASVAAAGRPQPSLAVDATPRAPCASR